MIRDVAIHQALFGYDAGHHLLASSIQLSPQAGHALAVATDLTGSAPPNGFERTITGMPVLGTGLYALFSTWLAPEMPRPGCVWSHVLLVESAHLARIQDLSLLRQFFTRPSKQRGTIGYKTILDWNSTNQLVDSQTAPGFLRFEHVIAKRLVELLYGSARVSIVLSALEAEEFEPLLFAIWSQQWPGLREAFRFSTGSFSDRGRSAVQFDVQVTPTANRRSWPHGSKFVMVDQPDPNDASLNGQWASAVVDDLVDPDLSGFRSFLSANACDVQPSRQAFGKVAQAFVAIRNTAPTEWPTVLAQVAQLFPASDEALTLKRATIRIEESDDNASVERAWAALQFLEREPQSGAFSGVQDATVDLVRFVWRFRRAQVADLLLMRADQAGQANWSQLATAVAEVVDSSDLSWIWDRSQDLLQTLVRLRPTIATQAAVWQLPHRAQWAVIDALESASITDEAWRQIVSAMLNSDTSVGIHEVAQLANQVVFDGALDWAKKQERLPGDSWRDTLARLAEARLDRESISPEELAFAVCFLPSYVAERVSASRPAVQELAAVPLTDLPVAVRLPTAFFLVALGLSAEDSVGGPLLARGFFAVHSALSTRTEPPNSWRLLQRQLPRFDWWEWDRCEKLRQATRQWFRRNRASQSTFLQAADTEADRHLAERLIS